MNHADDIYLAGFNAALDAAERAGIRILQGSLPTLRREHAACGLLGFVDEARSALDGINRYHMATVGADLTSSAKATPWSHLEGHTTVVTAAATVFAGSPKITRATAVAQGFTGDACDTCGSLSMQRAGSCLTCASCGTTTGCS